MTRLFLAGSHALNDILDEFLTIGTPGAEDLDLSRNCHRCCSFLALVVVERFAVRAGDPRLNPFSHVNRRGEKNQPDEHRRKGETLVEQFLRTHGGRTAKPKRAARC